MKVIKLTDQEFFFLGRAMMYLELMMGCSEGVRMAYKNPDQHYTWPLKRIREKISALDNEKKKENNNQSKKKV